MININYDTVNGTIDISDCYTASQPTFNKAGDEYALSFINLENVIDFTKFSYTAVTQSEYKYLTTYYRVSRDNNNWTPWLELKSIIDNFIPFDSAYNMFVDIKWIREGDSNTGTIYLQNYNLHGHLDIKKYDGLSVVKLNSTNNELIIKPPYIYKIFKINDIEILSSGNTASTTIYFRYSQDHGRTISKYIEFTKQNIISERINPIRFFQIEYLVNYTGTSSVSIYDINLIGDFQNISLDSQKTNLFGVRENCNCVILGLVNDKETYEFFAAQNESNTSMLLSPNITELYNLTPTDLASLYRPYELSTALSLLNKFSNDAVAILGHDAVYVLTDPDGNGTNYTIHEYQLENYVCDKLIKYSVDNNQFPDNQVAFNSYDMMLFDSFEIQITKENFKNAFGVDKRPNKDDLVWMCELNRLYQVEHAQQFRSFNNYAIYYKISLKKASDKTNIIGADENIQSVINDLMLDSSIPKLFDLENMQDKKANSNTEQFRSLSQDILRVEITANIQKEIIVNGSLNTISKSNYDLASVDLGSNAVVYRNFKNFFQTSDNIGFICWFNISTLSNSMLYNYFKYHDVTNGIRIDMIDNTFIITINSNVYEFDLTSYVILEDVWYSMVVNINQREQLLEIYLYKRNVDDEFEASMLTNNKLLNVYTGSQSIIPTIIDLSSSLNTDGTAINACILGSDMCITNIRMFIDVIPQKAQNKLLNSEIIGADYKYIIFADNANKKIVLPFFTDSRVDYNKIRRGTGLDTGNIYETGSDTDT